MNLDASKRWGLLDRLVHQIEKAGSEHFQLEGTKYVNTLKGLKTYEDKNFRVRVKRQRELLKEVEETGKTVKWGQYLRAPDVYFEILEKCRDKLVPLKEVADIRRGYTTGINEFFYLTDENIQHWGIEDEFLAPIIKSFKEIDSILVDEASAKFRLFKCHKDRRHLRGTNALTYIENGEKSQTDAGTLWPQVPSVKNRKRWYDVGERKAWDFFVQENWNDRFLIPLNRAQVLSDKRLYDIKAKKNAMTLAAVLNSSLTFLFMETNGRCILGEGALDLTVYEFEEMCVANVSAEKAKQKALVTAFEALWIRPVKPIYEEVNMKDRQKLDRLVLQVVGLDPKKYLQPIYDGLCQLVSERLQLAKMRKTIKGFKEQRDTEKLKEDVTEEVLPQGAKKFPEQFITPGYLKNAKEISVPKEPLRLGHFFMGLREVVSDEGFKHQAESDEEAKFIIYSQKPDEFVVKMPKSRIAVRNAVDKYERYVKELKGKLFKAFFDRTAHDHNLAENLTARVLEELGIREV